MNKLINLIGVPLEEGAGILGSSSGPKGLRIAGIQNELERLGYKVNDFGDIIIDTKNYTNINIDSDGKVNNPYIIKKWIKKIYETSNEFLNNDGFPIFMGGDHSISIGTINFINKLALSKGKKLIVLWIDAHSDFNRPSSSETGNIHGMSVSALTGEPELNFLFEGIERNVIDTKSFFQFGIRSVDLKEKKIVREKGINVYDMRSIDEIGLCKILKEFISQCKKDDVWVHLSFDADSLDPSFAPGTGTKVYGGFTYREAHLIMEMLYESKIVRSMDVVELNPFLDNANKTAGILVELISSLFGKVITLK